MAGIRDLVQRTRDGHTGQVLCGRVDERLRRGIKGGEMKARW
jgi:hypothetical protein